MLYAVSHISFFDSELVTEFREADNEFDALLNYMVEIELIEKSEWENYEINSVEELKQFAFDCDAMVNAVEVPKQ